MEAANGPDGAQRPHAINGKMSVSQSGRLTTVTFSFPAEPDSQEFEDRDHPPIEFYPEQEEEGGVWEECWPRARCGAVGT